MDRCRTRPLGRNLAHLARLRFLASDPRGKRVAVPAGTSGHGGGALACARRLANGGALVAMYLTRPAEHFTPAPAQQLDILPRMQVALFAAEVADSLRELSGTVIRALAQKRR